MNYEGMKRERDRDKDGEMKRNREREREISSFDSLLRCLSEPGLHKAKLRRQALHAGSHMGVRNSSVQGHLLLSNWK